MFNRVLIFWIVFYKINQLHVDMSHDHGPNQLTSLETVTIVVRLLYAILLIVKWLLLLLLGQRQPGGVVAWYTQLIPEKKYMYQKYPEFSPII